MYVRAPSALRHVAAASDYELSDERRRILAAVRAEDGIGPKAIAEASGVSHDVVRQLVRKMADDGQLDTDNAGHYFAPTPPDGLHIIHSVHSLTESGERSEQSEGVDG